MRDPAGFSRLLLFSEFPGVTPKCPKTRACLFSSRLAVIVTQDSTQALAAFDRARPRERIELGPDELILQPLVVLLLVIMEEEI